MEKSDLVRGEEHDACRTCLTPRKETVAQVWGADGWQCAPCAAGEHEAERSEALAAMPEGFTPLDYRWLDDVTCPYCRYEFGDSSEHYDDHEAEHHCPRCNSAFMVTAEASVTFDCQRIGYIAGDT